MSRSVHPGGSRSRAHPHPADGTRSQIPQISTVLRQGWYFPIPFVVLIYALFWLNYEAEMAGLFAIASALVLALIFPFKASRLGLRDLYECCAIPGCRCSTCSCSVPLPAS